MPGALALIAGHRKSGKCCPIHDPTRMTRQSERKPTALVQPIVDIVLLIRKPNGKGERPAVLASQFLVLHGTLRGQRALDDHERARFWNTARNSFALRVAVTREVVGIHLGHRAYLSGNVAPEIQLLVCSCFCTSFVWRFDCCLFVVDPSSAGAGTALPL